MMFCGRTRADGTECNAPLRAQGCHVCALVAMSSQAVTDFGFSNNRPYRGQLERKRGPVARINRWETDGGPVFVDDAHVHGLVPFDLASLTERARVEWQWRYMSGLDVSLDEDASDAAALSLILETARPRLEERQAEYPEIIANHYDPITGAPPFAYMRPSERRRRRPQRTSLVAVCTTSFRVFRDYVLERGAAPGPRPIAPDGTEYVFASSPDRIRGMEIDDYVVLHPGAGPGVLEEVQFRMQRPRASARLAR